MHSYHGNDSAGIKLHTSQFFVHSEGVIKYAWLPEITTPPEQNNKLNEASLFGFLSSRTKAVKSPKHLSVWFVFTHRY